MQTRSDWFVYCVLCALPWIGSELNERSNEHLQAILEDAEEYVRCVCVYFDIPYHTYVHTMIRVVHIFSQRDKLFLPAIEVFMTEDFEQDEDVRVCVVLQDACLYSVQLTLIVWCIVWCIDDTATIW